MTEYYIRAPGLGSADSETLGGDAISKDRPSGTRDPPPAVDFLIAQADEFSGPSARGLPTSLRRLL